MADVHFLSGNEAITVIRSRINEPTANRWTDVELTRWLDRGARNISAITLCNMTSEEITIVANTMRYTLSNKYIKIESVNFDIDTGADDTHKGLARMNVQGIGQLFNPADIAVAANVLEYYFIWGDYIYLWPPPTAALVTAGKPTVFGYTVVENYSADYTAVASNLLPNYLCPVAVDYAVACAYTKIGKHSLAALNMQRYMSSISFHRSNVYGETNRVDTYDMTKMPDRTVVQSR